MFKITFFDVGQGDTILLEWTESSEDRGVKIGIIDCKEALTVDIIKKPDLRRPPSKLISKSPIAEYLQEVYPDLQFIEFVLVSHPHKDHFSGIEATLEYCAEKAITIGCFFHTWSRIVEYLNLVNRSDVEFLAKNEKLTSLFKSVLELKEKKIILNEQNIDDYWFSKLTDKVKIKFSLLCPTQKEYGFFSERTSAWSNLKQISVDKSESNDDSHLMNMLSTLVEIFVDEEHKIVLTSDINADVIAEYLYQDHKNYASVLIQVPHHGALNNHRIELYNSIKAKEKSAIISVGNNRKYKHPSKKVVEDLVSLDYKIYSTNYVFGLREVIPIKQESLEGTQVFNYLI